ncbi:MAG: GtrA family protein [Nocardioidaceae bacterium]
MRLSPRFGRYLVTGVASVAVDTGVLVTCRSGLHAPLWLATSAAFVTSFLVNFGLNRWWVFDARDQMGARLARYAVLVGVNYGVAIVLVLGLTWLGLFYVLARWTSVAACVAMNYWAYRRWVFI